MIKRIGFVGAGNMARALGGGLGSGASGARDFTLIATDPVREALDRFCADTGGKAARDAEELLRESDVVVLAVKPQVLPAVLPRLARALEERHLVVSIAAGVTLPALGRELGATTRIVRAMPNTPALVREGISVLVAGGAATAADLEIVERIFSGVGQVVTLDDEALMDAVTAVSGSGPGFVFAYGEALLRGAEAAGLPADLALKLVRQTLYGAASLWRQSAEPVEALRAMVTSPGGTTLAGLEALEARGFAAAVRAAIEAAARRSRELSAG